MIVEKLHTLSNDIILNIENEHDKYEKSNNIDLNYEKFYLILRKYDEIIGILQAYTAYKEIYIEDLIVFEKYRKHGYGRELLLRLEDIFKDKDYNNINLVTNEFQAVEFYKRCGFELEFIRKNIQNPKLNKYFFVKYF